jgi:hypothetical protein
LEAVRKVRIGTDGEERWEEDRRGGDDKRMEIVNREAGG